jgi:hypothetical protein
MRCNSVGNVQYLNKTLFRNNPVGHKIQIVVMGTESNADSAFFYETDIIFAVTNGNCILYIDAVLFSQLKKNI